MSQRRSYLAAAELDGLVYAAGGMVGETGRPLATLARYEPERGPLAGPAALPVPTRAAAAAAVGGVIYVIGGTTPEGTRGGLGVRPEAGEWTSRAPLPGGALQPRRSRARRPI